jgi:hypothetical protein
MRCQYMGNNVLAPPDSVRMADDSLGMERILREEFVQAHSCVALRIRRKETVMHDPVLPDKKNTAKVRTISAGANIFNRY